MKFASLFAGALIAQALYSGVTLADTLKKRPELPERGEDTALFGKHKTAKAFFEERATDTDCRKELEATEKVHDRVHAELQKLLEDKRLVEALAAKEDQADADRVKKIASLRAAIAGKLDEKEEELTKARNAFYLPMEKCGYCASHPVEGKKLEGKNEVWFIADGSCYLPDAGAAGYTAARDAIEKSPLGLRRFGGFPALMNFVVVDGSTGELKEDVKSLEKRFPLNVFVAMFGTDLGFTTLAYGQYFGATWTEEKFEGAKTVWMKLQSEKPPLEYQEPPIVHITAGGTEKATTPLGWEKMGVVMASWYLTDSGYFRYFSAGDFRANIPFLGKEGRKMTFGTVIEMAKRYRAGK